MDRAIELAREASAVREVPIGAVIVKDGIVIAEGRNTREGKPSALGHAEIEAINAACVSQKAWRLSGCELYVTLEPCPMCLAAAQQARIDRVVFGAWDPKGGALSLGYRLHEDVRINHRFAVDYQETPECARLLREFFKELR